MQVNVLGPLEVTGADGPVAIPGSRLRTLLLRLAVAEGRPVSARRLVEAVWVEDPPADPANALQSLVSRLRRALGDSARVLQGPAGYRLAVEGYDVTQFSEWAAEGSELARTGRWTPALARLDAALGLWRGPALADVADAEFAEPLAVRWEKQRGGATLDRLATLIALDRAAEALPELEQLAAGDPLSERTVALLMRALTATGRQPEALQRYDDARRFLAESLGADPSPELQALHLELLRGPLAEIPAAAAAAARAGNLRTPLTSFVGRAEELARLGDLVDAHRLIGVIGTGGAGKTRLATEAATAWSRRTGAPGWLVELAPVSQPEQVQSVVLGALGPRETRITERDLAPVDDRARLLDRLRDADCLIVIDNCEHLLEETARVVDDLLAHAPGVRVLATSREPLGITGEVLFGLGPLPVPAADAALAAARRSPAVQLWLDRARASSPDFVLDEASAGAVIEIVRRLDGLPLAIELAAARLRVLPLTEIASRLEDRFRLLTGGNRAALPRHRTLRAVVAWSWDLLTESERLLAERLAVFPAGTDAAGAAAVCADERLPADEVDDTLSALADKSIVVVVGGVDGSRRFRMLETIREYGLERLVDSGELTAVRAAHASYLLDFVVRQEPRLRRAEQLEALAALDVERDNIAAALQHLLDSGRERDGLRLCLALVWYWSLQESQDEAIGWLRSVVAAPSLSDEPDLIWARAVLAIEDLFRSTTQATTDSTPPPEDRLRTLIEAVAELPDPEFPGLAAFRPMMALVAGRADLADQVAQRALQSPDPWLRAAVHTAVANMAENEGDLEATRRAAEIAYTGFAELGDRWGLASSLSARAQVADLDGRLDDALRDYRRSLRLLTEIGPSDDTAYLRLRVANVLGRLGDLTAAQREMSALRDIATGGRLGERGLFAEASLVLLDWSVAVGQGREGDFLLDLEDRIDTLRRRVLERLPPSPLAGHAVAIVLSATAFLEIVRGHPELAADDLDQAYPAGVGTRDMPVLAGVGLAVAAWAAACGQSAEAAVLLGATAQLRGGDESRDPIREWVGRRIEPDLGDRFAEQFRIGRTLERSAAIERVDPAQVRRR